MYNNIKILLNKGFSLNIKVIYTKSLFSIDKLQEDEYDYFILTEDNWNDYGYETTFKVTIIKDKEIYDDGFSTKILIGDEDNITSSREIFNKYLNELYIDTLDFDDIQERFNFISISLDYQELYEIFDEEAFLIILKKLNDVLYIKKYEDNEKLLKFIETYKEPFHDSLLRDQICKKMYNEGLDSLLTAEELDTSNYFFDFYYKLNNREYKLDFNFIEDKLPSRINILIGKNGVGKTKVLENLVNHLKNPKDADNSITNIINHPNFISNLFVFSYNTYDDFYIYKYGDEISIKYKYLGFRRYKTISDFLELKGIKHQLKRILDVLRTENYEEKLLLINNSEGAKRTLLYNKEVQNIQYALELSSEVVQEYLDIALEYINEVFIDINNHDELAFYSILELNKRDIEKSKYSDNIPMIQNIIEYINEFIPKIHFLAIQEDNELLIYDDSKTWEDILIIDCPNKVFFLDKEEKIIPLSSGQRVFTNLIINFCSMIRENSLIIIDEPENTLHPNFELGFMNILQKVLADFNSFAIIATHSAIITREVPTEYVNIIIEKDDVIDIQKPFIKTFGASITDITNYIFDDIFESTTFHNNWLKKIIKNNYLDKLKTFDEFKTDYNEILSYQLLLEAKNIFNGNSYV